MEKVRLKNPILIILVFSIRLYQILISPILGPKCRFYPSCSQYCIESLKKFGLFKGIFFSVIRLKECHPYGKSGFDPVRENRRLPRAQHRLSLFDQETALATGGMCLVFGPKRRHHTPLRDRSMRLAWMPTGVALASTGPGFVPGLRQGNSQTSR